MASITSCGQTTNKTPVLNEDEKRIIVILDTLQNDYYWQTTSDDLLGHLPQNYFSPECIKARREKYPFRAARDDYWQELDSLLDKKLSEDFLISLLNSEHRQELGYLLQRVPEKLFDCQTDNAYAALYHFAMSKIEYYEHYEIIIKLLKNNQYKDEIRNYVLQTEIDETFIDRFFYQYVYILGKETDKQIIEKTIQYAKSKRCTKPFSAYWAARAVIHNYYGVSEKAFENRQTKICDSIMENANDHGKTYTIAQNTYYRIWTKNALRWYYEMQEKINE